MNGTGEVLVQALFIAMLANRLLEAIVAPLKKREKLEDFDWWWLIYVSWVFAGLLSWVAGLNLFADHFDIPLFGEVLTAVVVGGGANLINDLFGGTSNA